MKACSLSPISSASCISSLAIASHASVSLGQRERGVGAVERVRERPRIVEPSGDLDRLAAQGRSPLGHRVIAQGTGEAREQPRP